jgi:hypothetical protein
VVDVGGAIGHGDYGDHCLQAAGGLHLAPEEKLGALFQEEESGRCCLFLAVTYPSDNRSSSFVSKSTLLFNVMSDTINTKGLKSKDAAKMAIKKNCDKIQSRLPKSQ